MSVLVVSGSSTVMLNEPLWYPSATISLGSVPTLANDLADPDYVWRTQRSVRTVLGFVARNIAQIALHPFTLEADGDRARLDRTAELARVLRSPSPGSTAFRHMQTLVTDLGLWDRYAELKVRDTTGRIGLHRLPPRQWVFRRDSLDTPTHIEYSPSGVGAVQTIPLDNCVWIDGYPHPDNLRTSPMEALQDLLLEQTESAEYRAELWANGGRWSAWVERPLDSPPWSKTARTNFRNALIDGFTGGGARAGGFPILEEGMQLHEATGITPEQAQQIESRKLSISEVAAHYHIPPVFVGVLDNANYSNVSAYRQMLYDDVLGPSLRDIEQAYQDRLVPDLEDPDRVYVEFNVGEKLRMSFEQQAQVLNTATGGPIMTRNEGRQRLNLRRIDDPKCDELIVPLNLAGADEASLSLPDQINAATALIRAGFEPAAALRTVGLDPITHLDLVPITVKPLDEPSSAPPVGG